MDLPLPIALAVFVLAAGACVWLCRRLARFVPKSRQDLAWKRFGAFLVVVITLVVTTISVWPTAQILGPMIFDLNSSPIPKTEGIGAAFGSAIGKGIARGLSVLGFAFWTGTISTGVAILLLWRLWKPVPDEIRYTTDYIHGRRHG